MEANCKKALLGFLFLVFCVTLHAQDLWKQESAESQAGYTSRNQGLLPETFKFFRLNASLLQASLSGVSQESDQRSATSEITIPLPDGSFITASLYESSILSPALQAIIPNVRTYMLVNPITGSSMGRVTIADKGITGTIFTDKGTVYINPVNADNDRVHISYYTKDLHMALPVGCGVTDEFSTGRENGTGRINAGDCHLRTYKLAVAATGEYYTWAGSSLSAALTYITTTINSVDAVYERDVTIRFTLVTTNAIIYTNAGSDPYTTVAFPSGTTLSENNTATDLALGSGNYDVGIVFNNAWNGGLAQLNSVCTASHGNAAAGLTFGTGSNPTAGPQGPVFEGTVAHEIAHQFSATHTMASNNGGCAGNTTAATAYEPGGGSTLMAYAGTCSGNSYQNNSDLYFHVGSVAQIAAYATTGNGNICPTNSILTNIAPTVSVAAASYTIPVSTPFILTCSASDLNANSLTYTWEQMDANAVTSSPPSATATTGPNFRSFFPSSTATRYLPNLTSLIAASSTPYEVLPSVTRTMNFRVNVRDNASGGGCNAQADIAVNTNAGAGPFTVTSQSSATSFTANGSNTMTITWNVANTNIAPVSCATVDILFSADGGQNFNYTLLTGTANDGTQTITVPNIVTASGRIMVKANGNIFFNINSGNITIGSSCGAEGAALSPSSTINASPGSASLNLSSSPTFGSVINPMAGTLQSTDPTSNLAVFSSVSSTCVTFGNQFQYDLFTFQVNVAGTYVFTNSGGNIITNLYTGSYTPSVPCSGFIASNGTYNGSLVNISGTVSGSLIPGITYTLAVGTFASGTPAVPFAYSVSVSGPGNTYTGYPNPGGTFSYYYVIVNNSTNNIVEIKTSPDLSNATTYPTGSYTVYGFSFLTANFSGAALTAYQGGPFSTLTNDLYNNPASKCGNLSKNNVQVNIFVVLPVKFLPLTAVWENQHVRLYWSTASESNGHDFEIERSANGQTFIPVKTVAATGNSSVRTNYTETDDVPLPDKGYYRIKATDMDGKFTYSNIAAVKAPASSLDVRTYPNPVSDNFNIEILAPKNGTGTMNIVGANGSVVAKRMITWKKGMNVETIDVKKYASGIYYINIMTDTEVITQKMIRL